MPLLQLEHISKSYPAKHGMMSAGNSKGFDSSARKAVLTNIDIQIEEGGSLGLVGKSGAGKTTLAQIISGLIEPDEGRIFLDGAAISPSGDLKQWVRSVQLVWQNAPASLDPRMKLGRALAEPIKIQKNPSAEPHVMVEQLMTEVNLDGSLMDRYPHELSGGQAQRAVIARALAMEPRLMVLDEPASALDARVKQNMVALLKRLRAERGLALLVISHDVGLAAALSDTIAILDEGQILESGAAGKVLSSPSHELTRSMLDAIPRI